MLPRPSTQASTAEFNSDTDPAMHILYRTQVELASCGALQLCRVLLERLSARPSVVPTRPQ